MQSGKLRHLVTIQQFAPVQNATGEPVKTWSDVVSVYGRVEPLSGREFFQGQQFNSEIRAVIKVRYCTGISTRMRALYAGRIYNIEAVINTDERDRELQLVCSEGLNDG